MGLFDVFRSRGKRGASRAAQAKERSGDLGAAVELYVTAGLPDEAARVLLLRADAEPLAERRMALAAAAEETAASEPLRKRARARRATIAFDVLRRAGAPLRGELCAIAETLEEVGEPLRAAEAYALAGDAEGEQRALTAAGAIEKLEERIEADSSERRASRSTELALRRIADLDRTAERRAALAVADALEVDPPNERVVDRVRAIRARLARGPIVDLEIGGKRRLFALGDEVTIGRGDATIVVASPAVSRVHVRLRRAADGPIIEDLDTRNGTSLAGARIQGALPVGDGVTVELGGEIRCHVEPFRSEAFAAGEGAVVIEVAGSRVVAPLGPLAVGAWRLLRESAVAGDFVVLESDAGARPFLGEYELAPRVELCAGDEIAASRGGEVVLRVIAGRTSGSGA